MSNWKKTFFALLTGQSLSKFTSSILQFAIVWHINAITNSAFSLSIAMLLGFLPRALLGSFVGVFIDRFNRKTIMITADLLIAGVSLLPLISSFFTGSHTVGIIYLTLFLRSIGSAFHEPASQAVVPQIVPKDQLVRCAGFSQAIDSISMILSPAVAAALYVVLSLNGIILLDVIGAISAVSILSLIKIPSNSRKKEKFHPSYIFKEAKEGFDILKSNHGLMGLVLVSSFYSLAMMPISALFPLMCTSYFGGTEFHAGLVETVFAVGLMIGALILGITGGTKNKVNSIILSCFLMSICLFLSGILKRDQFMIFAIAAFFMGFSGPFYWGTYRPLLQGGFKDEYLGRVLSLANSITVIASPIGMLVSGTFSEIFGAEKWFIVAGFMTTICGIVCLTVKNIHNSGLTTEGA